MNLLEKIFNPKNLLRINFLFIMSNLGLFILSSASLSAQAKEDKFNTDESRSTIAIVDVRISTDITLTMGESSRYSEGNSSEKYSEYRKTRGVPGYSSNDSGRSKSSSKSRSYDSVTVSNFNAVRSIQNSLRNILESDIVKTKKFNVFSDQSVALSGEYDSISDSERYMLLQDSVEYLLVPTIVDFHDKFTSVPIEGSQLLAKRKSFILSLDVKIHDVKEKKILDSFSAKITEKDLNPNFLNMDPNQTISDLYLNDICSKLSKNVVIKLLDSLFPARIVDESDGVFYINRGFESQLKEGDEFEVYSKGREIRDPDTNAVLGHREQIIGKIKILEIMGKNLSTCRTIKLKDDNRSIKLNDFVRKVETTTPSERSDVDILTNTDTRSKDEISKFNAVKSLRIRAANSSREIFRAKGIIGTGEIKIKNGRNLASRRNYTAGKGTDFERYVDNSDVRENGERMIEEGEKLIEEAKKILDDISRLYQSLYEMCDTVSIKSTSGKEVVCIPLIYQNGIFIVLVHDKVYSIKESLLDEDSRNRIQKYK